MVPFTHTYRIYEMLNKYFQNEADARIVASGIEEMVTQRVHTEKERLATKMDIMELKGDISQLRARMKHAFREQLKVVAGLMSCFIVIVFLLLKILG